MKLTLSVLAGVAAAALSLAAPAANAGIYIGLQQDAGPIVPVVNNAPGLGIYFLPFGQFEANVDVGIGHPVTPPPLLLQTAVSVINNAGSPDAGTLRVYVTSTNNTTPVGITGIRSGFSTTNLTPGWTETEQTWIDPNNGVFALTTMLDSETFTFSNGVNRTGNANVGPGPYSKTAVYIITAPTFGGSTAAISETAAATVVPEPASLALLGAALTGFGFLSRRRRKAA